MAAEAIKPPRDETHGDLLAAALDGRGRNARYRQNQLYFLHSMLRNNSDKARAAISEDTSCTEAEIDMELGMSMEAVKKLYDGISFEKSMEDEFRVVRKKDDMERRVPYGIVLLRPMVHTRFFCVVSVIASAFATGNGVLLEV